MKPKGDQSVIAGIRIPDTPAALEAASIAAAALPREIYYHALRTFLFAELFAGVFNLERDTELVYVASILHDTGLSPQYMSKTEHFAVDGANVARALLIKHGAPAERADIVWDAISLHDQGAIARWKRPEVRLVNAGVSCDFGAQLDRLNGDDVAAILGAAPRDRFVGVFLGATAAMIATKPSVAAPSWLTDVAMRMVHRVRYDNFVDAVEAGDPFSPYSPTQ